MISGQKTTFSSRWYALTIFLSAFLLFQVQPLIAKIILPWFGGGAGVWTACMLFFQCVLLLGYTYAHLLNSKLSVGKQALVHIIVLGLSLFLLPITPDVSWKPERVDAPTLDILLLLLTNVGTPFALLSATGPLLSCWFSLSHPQHSPYRLYALSNAGSLLALLSYPFIIAPNLGLNVQAISWSLIYGVFVVFCIYCAYRIHLLSPKTAGGYRSGVATSLAAGESAVFYKGDTPPCRMDIVFWFALTTAASVMLLATTHRICQDIAVVPLLWVIPLALYLLSFILCFDHSWWYKRRIFLPLLATSTYLVVILMKWQMFFRTEDVVIVHMITLFIICMVCHGELIRLKPTPRFLSKFYLVVACGGALGGILVAVLAPLVFNGFWEYHLGMIGACVLVMLCVFRDQKRSPCPSSTGAVLRIYVSWSVVILLVIVLSMGLLGTIHGKMKHYLAMTRNFYGVVQIKESGGLRGIVNGGIDHGSQFTNPAMRRIATSYFGRESGIGIALKVIRQLRMAPNNSTKSGLRIGVVGLGAGSMAALTESGDSIRFYEINRAVYRLAHTYFTYLDDTPAETDVVFGDARLSMGQEISNNEPQQFDLLAIDAFTSDAVPIHLLTREAMKLYFKHLVPNGVLAIHTSSNYANLSAVVRGIAEDAGLNSVRIYTPRSDRTQNYISLWVFVTRDRAFLDSELVQATETKWRADESLPIIWTDDSSSLWQAMAAEKNHSNGRWINAPNEGRFVVDSARIFTYRDYLRLLEICRLLYHKTDGSRAMVVVTIDKLPRKGGKPLSIEEYARQLYDRFKLDIPGKTEGVMLLFSTAHGKALLRFPASWPALLINQLQQQFIAATKDDVASGKNVSNGLLQGIEKINVLVRQSGTF